MTIRCVVLGSGGHGAVVADALLTLGVDVIGFLDNDPARASFTYLHVRVLGTDDLVEALVREGNVHFACGVGGTSDNERRRNVFNRAAAAGLPPMTVTHPLAHISPNAQIGPGAFVGIGAIVNTGANVGTNALINSGAIVEHHCRVGDHAHVATGAVLSGNVNVGDEAHVGANAVIRQGLRIGIASVVGAGAVVIDHVPPGARVAGNPARPIAVRTAIQKDAD